MAWVSEFPFPRFASGSAPGWASRPSCSRPIHPCDHRRRTSPDRHRRGLPSAAGAGLVVGSAGNVSARVGELIAVTPTGARLATLTAGEVAIVDSTERSSTGRSRRPPSCRCTSPSTTASTPARSSTPIRRWRPRRLCRGRAALLSLRAADPRRQRARRPLRDVRQPRACHERRRGPRGPARGDDGQPRRGHLRPDLQAAIDATELLEWACGVYVHASACGTPHVLSEDERAAVAQALAAYEYGRTAAAR